MLHALSLLAPVFRVASLLEEIFEWLSEGENDQREDGAYQADADRAEADGYADRGGHPDAGGRGESFDFLFAFELQNRTRADEADARYQTLNDTGHGIELHSHTGTSDHEDCCAQANHHVGAKACRLTRAFTLNADDSAEDHRGQQTNSDAQEMLPVLEAVGEFLPESFHFKKVMSDE
jgi:hypothetical protein